MKKPKQVHGSSFDSNMKLFVLQRDVDKTGTSGTGVVAEGCQFTSGKCVLTWLTPHTSIAVYENIASLEVIHGHDGATKVVWVDV